MTQLSVNGTARLVSVLTGMQPERSGLSMAGHDRCACSDIRRMGDTRLGRNGFELERVLEDSRSTRRKKTTRWAMSGFVRQASQRGLFPAVAFVCNKGRAPPRPGRQARRWRPDWPALSESRGSSACDSAYRAGRVRTQSLPMTHDAMHYSCCGSADLTISTLLASMLHHVGAKSRPALKLLCLGLGNLNCLAPSRQWGGQVEERWWAAC
jgi:hypothetical protein